MSCDAGFESVQGLAPVNLHPKRAFLMNVARKRVKRLQNPVPMLISLFSAPTVPNLKAQTWKMASGMTKMRKSVIGSVCAYLRRCKAHYQNHELGTLDE